MKYILYQYSIWNVFKEDFCICLSLDAFCIQTQLSNIHVVPLSYHKSNKCSFPFSYFYLSFSLIFLYFSFVHLFQSLVSISSELDYDLSKGYIYDFCFLIPKKISDTFSMLMYHRLYTNFSIIMRLLFLYPTNKSSFWIYTNSYIYFIHTIYYIIYTNKRIGCKLF